MTADSMDIPQEDVIPHILNSLNELTATVSELTTMIKVIEAKQTRLENGLNLFDKDRKLLEDSLVLGTQIKKLLELVRTKQIDLNRDTRNRSEEIKDIITSISGDTEQAVVEGFEGIIQAVIENKPLKTPKPRWYSKLKKILLTNKK